jgi:protein-S-isoprenylcysteine O-methyltransferase Ste14
LLIGFSLVASAVRENITRLGGWRKLGSMQKYPIQTGPYRYSRNPMYLAVALIWLGWTMLFGSWLLLGGLLVMLGGISIIGIPFEERQWETSLGNAYLQYKKQVARWLGKRKTA